MASICMLWELCCMERNCDLFQPVLFMEKVRTENILTKFGLSGDSGHRLLVTWVPDSQLITRHHLEVSTFNSLTPWALEDIFVQGSMSYRTYCLIGNMIRQYVYDNHDLDSWPWNPSAAIIHNTLRCGLWPSDPKLSDRFGSTLDQVMVCSTFSCQQRANTSTNTLRGNAEFSSTGSSRSIDHILIYWGWDKLDKTLHTFSNAFSWMKIVVC